MAGRKTSAGRARNEAPEKSVPIRVVADTLGIPIPTIRSWERRYGFPRPERTGGKHRRYSIATIEDLRALRNEIARGRAVRDAVDEVLRKRAETDTSGSARVEALIAAAHDLDRQAIHNLLDIASSELGFEVAIQKVGMPFLERVGALWEIAQLDVAHEHLATGGVRDWIARATRDAQGTRGTIVVACGPEDAHCAGAEGWAAIMMRRGWDIRLLGALTPGASLAASVDQVRPAAVVVVSHIRTARRAAVAALRLVEDRGSAVYFAGGAFVTEAARRNVPGIYLGEDLIAAADLVEQRSVKGKARRT